VVVGRLPLHSQVGHTLDDPKEMNTCMLPLDEGLTGPLVVVWLLTFDKVVEEAVFSVKEEEEGGESEEEECQ
jgi:hypothetical protein